MQRWLKAVCVGLTAEILRFAQDDRSLDEVEKLVITRRSDDRSIAHIVAISFCERCCSHLEAGGGKVAAEILQMVI